MFLLVLIALAILFGLIWAGKKFAKGKRNEKIASNPDYFSQGDVTVNFKTGKISIKGKSFDVNDVTGIKAEPYDDKGRNSWWNAVIEMDDIETPRHKVMFTKRVAAETFTQRLSVALRKAGGPSFV